MTEVAKAPQAPEDDGELLDRIDALRVLRADSDDEKGRLLEEIAGTGKVEQEIVSQLSMVRPLWRPEQFDQTHRLMMRSLEVLDRNGARPCHLPPIGPLKPIAGFFVQQVTRWIVKGFQNEVVTKIRKLYERREANSVWRSREHVLLRRARIDATRIEEGITANPIGLPKILLGGAFLSGIFSALSSVLAAVFKNAAAVVIVAAAVVAVFLALAWVALYSAAIARRRIRLCTDQPIKALWTAIGAAGDPPRDQSVNFAIYAIVLLILAAIVIPIAVGLIVTAL